MSTAGPPQGARSAGEAEGIPVSDAAGAPVPTASYGVLERTEAPSATEAAVESVRLLGYAVLDSCHTGAALERLSSAFDSARARYRQRHGIDALQAIDEEDTVRLMMAHDDAFRGLAFDEHLLAAVSALLPGKFILNQQNGIANPSHRGYNQGAWHRDLPYQHFVASRPLAINALFCIDDFTRDNGATFVLPASHRAEPFPSDAFVARHALQLQAKAGQFVLLDAMTFHAGGYNGSGRERRAVNHVFTIPYFKQQIRIAGNIDATGLSAAQRGMLGFDYLEPETVAGFLAARQR